jgi:hypothetical protein
VLVAGPRVLHRGEQAAVVLEHMTAHRHGLVLGVLSVAHGRTARAAADAEDALLRDLISGGPAGTSPPDQGARLATVAGTAASPLLPLEGSGSSRPGYEYRVTLAAALPAVARLDLLVSWPAAGLTGALVRLVLPEDIAERAARAEPFWPSTDPG